MSDKRRVKLYVLNEERQWSDRGTGHIFTSGNVVKGLTLSVISEIDGSLLLESKVQQETPYDKQQDTLIVWSESDGREGSYDLALSFQEGGGCTEIWNKINQAQGKTSSDLAGLEFSHDLGHDLIEESEEERFDDLPEAVPPVELPPCEMSRLQEIAELFTGVLPSPVHREQLAVAVEAENYIPRLLELFRMCEDLENTDGLHHIFHIVKAVFLLNRNSLLEILLSDQAILEVVGCLEYDPGQPRPQPHRQYLRTRAHYRQVVPIGNRELLHKIHQTYRIQYIQDVVLPTPSLFEENMLSTLSSFIFFNKSEIVKMIQEDDKFLPELFSLLTDESTEDDKRKELVLFLKEFCTFAQAYQNKDAFFTTLSNLGILPAIEIMLSMDDSEVQQAATDIFACILEHSSSMVREFILQEAKSQDEDLLLINVIIEHMICDTDPDLSNALQLVGLIRVLIDPENMVAAPNKMEKSEFLSFFYRHCLHVLTAPLLATTAEERPSKDDYQTAQLLSIILELLAFCVEHHSFHCKNYIINKDLLRRILVLMSSKHSFLVLCVVRLMRRIISLKDDFYNRHIIKGDLFRPIVQAFLKNGDRYNLLNSAILELFEFIRWENIKLLIVYIVENYGQDFESITYVKTFKELKVKYDQHMESMEVKSGGGGGFDGGNSSNLNLGGGGNRYRRDDRSLDEDEEIWFSQEDESEEGEVPAPAPATDADTPVKSLSSSPPPAPTPSPSLGSLELDHALGKHTDHIKVDEVDNSNGNNSGGGGRERLMLATTTNTGNARPSSSVLNNKVAVPHRPSAETTSSSEVKENKLPVKKGGLVGGGLVDYDPDSDEDEDEEDEGSVQTEASPAKRPRIGSP